MHTHIQLHINAGERTVRVFEQQCALEDAIDSHACSLEALASMRPMTFPSGVHSSYRLTL
jgi:hypothetical protein